MNDTTAIDVLLDGQPRSLPPDTTLASLVASLGHVPTDVTTAVNGQFVPRGARERLALQSGDAVLLFQPIVGG